MDELRIQVETTSETNLLESQKDTEIGPAPEDWESVRLDSLAQLRSEGIHPEQAPHLSYVGLEHIDSGNARLSRWGKAASVRSGKSHFYSGDVLYGKLRPYLDKAVLTEQEGICSTDILVLNVKERVDPAFLSYLLHHRRFVDHAIATTSGVNHPRTSWASIREFKAHIPAIYEQKAIAHVLRSIQRTIETTEQVIEASRELKRSLMNHLFTYGPVPVDEAEQVSLKETEIGSMPDHWEIVELGTVVSQAQYGLSKRGEAQAAFPILRMGNLNDGRVTFDSRQYVDLDQRDLSKFRLQKGDLLFNRTNSYELVGKTALFDLDGDYVFASYLIRVVTDGNKLISEYANYYLNSAPAQARLKLTASRGVSQSNINATKLKSLLVKLPPLHEQRAVCRMLGTLDDKIAVEESRNLVLGILFKTLLHNLMTGKIRVNDLTLSTVAEKV